MAQTADGETYEAGGASRFVIASDGIRLHAREYDAPGAATPVLCLPGLARTHLDFDPLARALSKGRFGKARRVIALDYRGRGLSDHDPAGAYDVMIENADALAVADALGLHDAMVIGTSRGGLHAMIMAVTRPAFLRGVVLNDVGPRIETQGLMRIRGYVGRMPKLQSLDQAVAMMREVIGPQFPALGEDDWRFFAATTYRQGPEGLEARYDPRLAKLLEALDLTQPLPELWPQFEALAHVPVLAIRGERSDLFAQATLEEMARRHPHFASLTAAGQGHAPLLNDEATMRRIAAALDEWEAGAPG